MAGRNAKQHDAGAATVKRLEGNFDKLCAYGRKSGGPLFERQIKEWLAVVKSCDDPIARALLLSNELIFAGYKQEVEQDCARAEAVRRPPRNAADYLARGKALYAKRDYDRAMSDFNEAIRLDPTLATAFYHRAGVLHYVKNDTSTALSDIRDAFRLDPKFGGSDYFSSGENDRRIAENIAIANNAIARSADFGNAYATRSTMNFYRGDFDSAIRDASKAISLYANDAAALNNRAIAYLKKGQIESAIGDLDEAILLAPKSSAMFRNRGNAHFQSGDLERALTDLDEAIRLDPKQQPAFAYRGQVYERMGQREKAISDYRNAIFANETTFYNVGLDAYLTAGKRLIVLLAEEKASK